jgi:hypothetical protein
MRRVGQAQAQSHQLLVQVTSLEKPMTGWKPVLLTQQVENLSHELPQWQGLRTSEELPFSSVLDES